MVQNMPVQLIFGINILAVLKQIAPLWHELQRQRWTGGDFAFVMRHWAGHMRVAYPHPCQRRTNRRRTNSFQRVNLCLWWPSNVLSLDHLSIPC